MNELCYITQPNCPRCDMIVDGNHRYVNTCGIWSFHLKLAIGYALLYFAAHLFCKNKIDFAFLRLFVVFLLLKMRVLLIDLNMHFRFRDKIYDRRKLRCFDFVDFLSWSAFCNLLLFEFQGFVLLFTLKLDWLFQNG